MSRQMAIGLLALVLVLGACGDDDEEKEELANPASVYCIDEGGTLEIRTDQDGNQFGVCVFADGSECGEWAFYRGECAPVESPGGETGLPNPASVYCIDEGGTLEIRTDQDGNQFGVCVFSDGSECEEWAFYRGECSPGG